MGSLPQLDWGRLLPKEIHDLSSLQGALVYIGNPKASPIPKTVGWVASVHNLLMPTQTFCTKISAPTHNSAAQTSCSHTVRNFNWKRLASTCKAGASHTMAKMTATVTFTV